MHSYQWDRKIRSVLTDIVAVSDSFLKLVDATECIIWFFGLD